MAILKRLLCIVDDDGNVRTVAGDSDTESLSVNLRVWNPTTLAWERMKQPSIDVDDLTVTMGDTEKLLAGEYFKRRKLYKDSNGNIEYICRNTDIDAALTDTGWRCFKVVYDSDEFITDIEGPLTGAVDSAPSGLAWNI